MHACFEDSLHKLIDICMTCPPEEFPENVCRLYHSLPKGWVDETLEEELKDATVEAEYSVPEIWCGAVVREDVIPGKKEVVQETNWYVLFTSILDCINRRGLLPPAERTEIITEKPEEEEK